jgi:aspergillopepsin I
VDIDIDSWFIPVKIGTPPQSFLMLGDTAAPTLSVANTLLPKKLQGDNPLFNPNKSSTAKQVPGETYSITFVSGYHSNGVVFQDTFSVGDLVLQDMYIGLPTNHSDNNSGDSGRSGNLGLSFAKSQSMVPTKEPTWLATIAPHLECMFIALLQQSRDLLTYLAAGLFTVDWHKSTGNGAWDFGFIDKSKYTGDIAYGQVTSISGGSGWTVQIVHGSNSMYVTVDTGTSGSHVTRSIADDYFSKIQGATYDSTLDAYTYPCTSDLIDFEFKVGGTQVAVPSAALSGGSAGNGRCQSKLQIGGDDAQKLIWGQDFIESMFIVFDWDNGRLGFANKS